MHRTDTTRSKYGAVRTMVDGISFASKREAHRYSELRLLEKAGEIRNLQLQKAYDLHVKEGSYAVKIGRYLCDFVYERRELRGMNPHTRKPSVNWTEVVEDVKSPATLTPLYRWKVKHLRAEYDIEVVEV